jgi:hypothetical protein
MLYDSGMSTPTEEQLLEVWRQLGPNAQKLYLKLGERLALGAQKYGDFPIRRWKKEAAEEALDMTVYLAAELCIDAEPVQEPKGPTPEAGC